MITQTDEDILNEVDRCYSGFIEEIKKHLRPLVKNKILTNLTKIRSTKYNTVLLRYYHWWPQSVKVHIPNQWNYDLSKDIDYNIDVLTKLLLNKTIVNEMRMVDDGFVEKYDPTILRVYEIKVFTEI